MSLPNQYDNILQILSQLVAVLHVEFVENAGDIVFYGAFGNSKTRGDYLVRKMFGNQIQKLAFFLGEGNKD